MLRRVCGANLLLIGIVGFWINRRAAAILLLHHPVLSYIGKVQ